jgi:hypothetical protein
MSVTEVPAADLGAHVPAVEGGRCELEAPTVKQHVGDSRECVPAQVQLLEPLEPTCRVGSLIYSHISTALVTRTCVTDVCKHTIIRVRFEVFTAVTMKNGIFWDVTPCGFLYFLAACVGC